MSNNNIGKSVAQGGDYEFVVVGEQGMGITFTACPVKADEGGRVYALFEANAKTEDGARAELRLYFEESDIETVENAPARMGVYLPDFAQCDCEEVAL